MDTEETTLDPALFDRVQAAMSQGGPAAAAQKLCDELTAAHDYQGLFYAMLLRARVEMGVSPFPTAPASELPAHTHEGYEDAIRTAGQHVGNIYLQRGDLTRAWGFFRMLGESEPIIKALDNYNPGPDDDTYAAIDIAWQQGVHPKKGFDIVLDRQGICSAITMVGSANLGASPEVRDYCVKKLITSLYEQLAERLKGDLEARGIKVPAGAGVSDMVKLDNEIFTEDVYHIDLSHLHSVVQFATQLSACKELKLASELCEYGSKLSSNLVGESPPPFDGGYKDFKVFIDILNGKDVEAGIKHFTDKLDKARDEGDTFPAETVVNLLLRLDRLDDALKVAKKYLNGIPVENCPNLIELARRAKDYGALAEAAKSNSDAVNFLAGLIARG